MKDTAEETPARVATIPHLIVRELAVAAVLLAGLLLLAVIFDAPLHAPANPGLSPNPTKAPWYFAGLQEMLLHFPPVLAVTVIPFLAALLLVLMPFVVERKGPAGVWFGAKRDRRAAWIAAAAGFVITLLWVFFDEYGWTGDAARAGGETGMRGLVLFVLWVTGLAGGYIGLRRWYALSRTGALQAVFVVLAAAFITLTVIGMAFRGPGMRLTWPGG